MTVLLYIAGGYVAIAAVALVWRLCALLWWAKYLSAVDDRLELVVEFAIVALLWPLPLIRRPSVLITPWKEWVSERPNDKGRYRAAFRGLADLRRVAPFDVTFFGEDGDFSITVELLRKWLAEKKERPPHLDALSDSLASFSQSAPGATCAVDGVFSSREIYELAGTGQVAIRCRKCDREIAGVEIVHADDRGKPGWRSKRYLCPAGHNLVSYRTIHATMRR